MLNPSMQILLSKVRNRYLLVNLTAQRARDIAAYAEENEIILDDKPVKIAMDEIAEGKIQYRPGKKLEPMQDPLIEDIDNIENNSTDTMENSHGFQG